MFVRSQLFITVWQQTFDYFGMILSYLVQIIPIFVLHSYEGKRPEELGTIISNVSLQKNSFIYLLLPFGAYSYLFLKLSK